MRWRRLASAVMAVIWLAGCTAPFNIVAPPNDEPAYSELYPFYAELCAVSQIRKKPGFGVDTSGGPGGHTVFYLNGVCRDRGAGYPTLEMCPPDTPREEQGVGLSVNAHFQNANWVATDGRGFFFHGDLKPGETLTRAAYARTLKTAEAKGIYDGVAFHPEVYEDMPAGMSRHDFRYDVSIATDYAIAFGRDRYCARVPVSRAQMVRMVHYLNGLNAIYRDGKTPFVWNVLQDNCAYLAHNALAVAGIWSEWPTNRPLLIAAFDFPVPKNEFVNLMRRTNDMDISDPGDLYDHIPVRRSLMQFGRLPMEPGALAEARRMWLRNDVYDTDVNLIFYDDPVLGSYRRHFHEIFDQPRYTDIGANLRYFAALYRRIQAREPAELRRGQSDGPGRRAFITRFYAYIDQEEALVDSRIAAIEPRPGPAEAGLPGATDR